jgi:cytochrome d ubiquinol oxidase subunit II
VRPGVFDWYTLLVGVFTLCLLAGHGGLYLVWKTAGPVHERSHAWARKAWRAILPLWGVVTLATVFLQPAIFSNLFARPWSLSFVATMTAGLWGVFYFSSRGRELAAFLSSSAFILGLMGAAMAGNYPFWLRSTIDPAYSLGAANTASKSYALQVGLAWWTIGITLAGGYFAYVFRSFRGKVDAEKN